MSKHQQLIAQLNLENGLSQKIRKQIAEYNELNESYVNAQSLAQQGDEEAVKDVAEFEATLQAMDDTICKAIQLYDKNKDHYARLADNLKKSRAAKKENGGSIPAPPTQQVAPIVQMQQTAPIVNNQPQQQASSSQQKPQNQQTAAPANTETKPKKKKNILGIVFGIATAAVACYFGLPALANAVTKKR